MSTATIDGLEVRYEIFGSGEPILMFAPGGFDATIEKWRTASAWTGIDALDLLAKQLKVIVYDRRESGESGGRVERLDWRTYARQAKALLDQLEISSAFIMGGCMGCSVALAFAVTYPESTRALSLHWPVGGFRWQTNGLDRFRRHHSFAKSNGLPAVIDRAKRGKSFWNDPEAGPWASVIARGKSFAEEFIRQDLERYLALVAVSGRNLFDRDTAPGAEPEELMGTSVPALIIPGDDSSHAMSAAHYLRELLPRAIFWSVLPPEQTTRNVCDRVLQFVRETP
jgi:pimeloyl-ACP methyl ester carboxylesterase